MISKILFKNRFSLFFLPQLMKMKITRDILFTIFNRLNFIEKEELYYHAKEIFLKKNLQISSGNIKVKFNGIKISIPHNEGKLFNLGTAFSYLGHDFEVKKCYLDIVNNFNIKTFYDVGANYGQHSVLMMSQGIKTFSFEPNKSCHNSLISTAKHNNFNNYKLINKAVGSSIGNLYLNFNPEETWNGKVSEIKSKIKIEISEEIKVINLDTFCLKHPSPELIKIDTEGHELEVLKGSTNLINNHRPFIIFESFNDKIFNFFIRNKYNILNIKNNYKIYNSKFENENKLLACPIEKAELLQTL